MLRMTRIEGRGTWGGGVIIEYFTTDSESQPGTYNVPGGFQ